MTWVDLPSRRGNVWKDSQARNWAAIGRHRETSQAVRAFARSRPNFAPPWPENSPLSRSSSSAKEKWSGPRSMVDLCDMVKRYYYHPLTQGSNSIKKVLPAVLNASKELQEKYSKPVYGRTDGIKSLNFKDRTWIELNSDGSVKDPYSMLPSVYRDISRNELDLLFGDDELADGGAAMMTYAMMQFTEMSNEERSALSSALLRYCELDTLAMVMLYEYWADVLGFKKGKRAA